MTIIWRSRTFTPRQVYSRAIGRARRRAGLPPQQARWYTKRIAEWQYLPLTTGTISGDACEMIVPIWSTP